MQAWRAFRVFVLKPGGWIFIDAPFLQPYCPDGADLWRFTEDGLKSLCESRFDVVAVEPSIATGPAIAFTAQAAARRGRNRAVDAALCWAVSASVWPLKHMPHADPRTAGAFLLVGRRREVEPAVEAMPTVIVVTTPPAARP